MLQPENRVTFRLISDAKDLNQIEHQWNTLVNRYSTNPFSLSEFARLFMEWNTKEWTPLVMVFLDGHAIVGLVLLKTRVGLLGRYAESLPPAWGSELILDERYRDTCVGYMLDFLFKTLKCKYVKLILPEDSPDLLSLDQQCRPRRVRLKATQESRHRIIPMTSTWAEFEASRKRKVRKELGRMKRNLDKTGPWRTICLEGREHSDVVGKILSLEERSWKEEWRARRGETDRLLLLILKAAERLAEIEPHFRWNVWFLELEGKIISYLLVIEYNGVANMVKTSYDLQYKRFSPGTVIQDAAIQKLFIEGQNKYIDFLGDLPWLQVWTDKCLPKITVRLTKGPVPTIIIQSVLRNPFVQRIFSVLEP